jgi:CMP/dCMP kinase
MRVVAIDGPAGSGKSTVSRMVAGALGWQHLDTGAFYRAATLRVLQHRADPGDERSVLDALDGAIFEQDEGLMFLDGEDVSDEIRLAPVTAAVSPVSAHPAVRRLMVAEQRAWVERHDTGVVVEGRDIGTVVFPDAALKVFLTADAGERARRRASETGEDVGVEEAAIRRRDRIDSSRQVSPLRSAADAYLLDTTGMTPDEVVTAIIARLDSVEKRQGG